MYGQNRAIHKVFIYADLESINIISLIKDKNFIKAWS